MSEQSTTLKTMDEILQSEITELPTTALEGVTASQLEELRVETVAAQDRCRDFNKIPKMRGQDFTRQRTKLIDTAMKRFGKFYVSYFGGKLT